MEVFIFGSFAIVKLDNFFAWQRAIAEGFILGRVAIVEAFDIISVIRDLFLDSITFTILGNFAIAKIPSQIPWQLAIAEGIILGRVASAEIILIIAQCITFAEDYNILSPGVSDIFNCHEVSAIYHIPSTLHVNIDVREVNMFLLPFFSSLSAIITYLLTSELYSVGADLTAAGMITIVPGYISRSVTGSYDNTGKFIVKKDQLIKNLHEIVDVLVQLLQWEDRTEVTIIQDSIMMLIKCDIKTNYMWVVSMFPKLHGREYEDFSSIQCSQV